MDFYYFLESYLPKLDNFTSCITTLWYCLVQKTVFYLFIITNASLSVIA